MLLKRLFLNVLNFLRFIKHRKSHFLDYKAIPQMNPNDWDIYCDKMAYTLGQPIPVCIRNTLASNYLVVEKIIAAYTYENIYTSSVLSILNQPITKNCSINGCDWSSSLTIPSSTFKAPGYYRIALSEGEGAYFTIIISDPTTSAEVIILAPCSTWTAYNPWGGKSLYLNGLDKKSTFFVSTQRPNSALEYNKEENIHDINVEATIFNWFSSRYTTSIYPDYILEENPAVLADCKIIVLAYHGEYFSDKMYRTLRELIQKKKKSYINLGGNQIYWKVKWHNDFKTLECRKNCSPFENTFDFGGLWRNSLYPEKKLLGVYFSDPGTGTYAPYQVTDPTHWLFNGTNVTKGQLFGIKGINELGICGDETDKSFDSISIAKGMNAKDVGEYISYPNPNFKWNQAGGGDICIKELSEKQAILATGSIQSGAGLGVDSVFTAIIKNFTEKYLQQT